MKLKASMKDVAAAAGVTTMTVSRVFRGRGEHSDETGKLVMQCAKKLGYGCSYCRRIAVYKFRLGDIEDVKAGPEWWGFCSAKCLKRFIAEKL